MDVAAFAKNAVFPAALRVLGERGYKSRKLYMYSPL